jgi:hypothetical protein
VARAAFHGKPFPVSRPDLALPVALANACAFRIVERMLSMEPTKDSRLMHSAVESVRERKHRLRAFAVLLFIAIVDAAQAAELCADADRKTVPDMRIEESDLTRHAASAAALELRRTIDRGDLGDEFQMGTWNRLKIIKGYVLLQRAHADQAEAATDSMAAAESKAMFCDWLVKDGFWYD